MAQHEQYHPRYPLLEKYYDDNHRGRKLEERLEVGLEALVNLLMDGLKLDCHVVGDRPRGPLKQRENPHLNPCIETR
jgi:hypothetical protein